MEKPHNRGERGFRGESVNLASSNHVKSVLNSSIIEKGKNTLILAECVFMYLEVNQVEKLLDEIKDKCCDDDSNGDLQLISYDALDKSDNFSKMMQENLLKTHDINLHMQNDQEYESLLKKLDFCSVINYSMLDVYNHDFLSDTRRDIERLVFLDDVEIWNQIMGHYSLILGGINKSSMLCL